LTQPASLSYPEISSSSYSHSLLEREVESPMAPPFTICLSKNTA
jgi:hypothetical protein